MKKLLSLVLAGSLFVACTDYDSQFDQLQSQVEELAAANAALEAQLAGMAALNAQVAQATAAQLAGFQTQVGQITAALTSIVSGLNELGTANQGIAALVQALTAQVQAINAQIAVITANIDGLSGDSDALSALMAALQEAIATINNDIASLSDQITASNGDQVVLSGDLTNNRTLLESIDYYLDGDFTVTEGVVLTVPAGTAIVAKTAGSKIVVEAGAGIDIQGTTAKPVYMTKLASVSSWDGVHVYGSINATNLVIQSSTVGIGLLEEAVATSRPENPSVNQAVDITDAIANLAGVILDDITNHGILVASTNHSVAVSNLLARNSENVFTFSAVPISLAIANVLVNNTIATSSVFNFTTALDISAFAISNVSVQSTATYPAILSASSLSTSKLKITGLTSPVVRVLDGGTAVTTSSAFTVGDVAYSSSNTYNSSTLNVTSFLETYNTVLENAGTEDNISTGGHHSGGGSTNGSGSEEHGSGGAHHSGGGSTNG